MARVFIGVGSNIEPEENIRKALTLLSREVRITGISTFYCTKALDRPEQADFINGVLEIDTDIRPMALKYQTLVDIEDNLGRKRSEDKYAPRTIDLDILIYDELISTDGLVLPDPDIRTRPFLAIPLSELAPDLVLPGHGLQIESVAASMKDHGMVPLRDFTESLKGDLGLEQREG